MNSNTNIQQLRVAIKPCSTHEKEKEKFVSIGAPMNANNDRHKLGREESIR